MSNSDLQGTDSACRRVLSLVERASALRSSQATVDAWGAVASGGIHPANHYEVVRRLGLWAKQVDSVEVALRERGVPENRFLPQLAAIRSSLRVTELAGPWDAVVRSHLTPEVVSTIGAFAWTLPAEEPVLSDRERTHLTRLAALWRASSDQDPSLSPLAKRFIEGQVRRFHQALCDTDIVGAEAIVGQLRDLTTDVQVSQSVLHVPSSSRASRVLRILLRRTTEVVVRLASAPGTSAPLKLLAWAGLSAAAAHGAVSLDVAGWAMIGVELATQPKLLGAGPHSAPDATTAADEAGR